MNLTVGHIRGMIEGVPAHAEIRLMNYRNYDPIDHEKVVILIAAPSQSGETEEYQP